VSTIEHLIQNESRFSLRRAVERLREGLFDPLAVNLLTMDENRLNQSFSTGLQSIDIGESDYLCVRGSYGQGKSHSLAYLKDCALSKGYAVSLVNLDLREVPFNQFDLVYRKLMSQLKFPNGKHFIKEWKKWASEQLKCDEQLQAQDLLPSVMPHRFKMILTALLHKNLKLSPKQKLLKKHRNFRPKEYNYSLEKALMGDALSTFNLKKIFKYRDVPAYREQSLACRGNEPYVQMIQGLACLFRKMNYKGWIILFDECESIAQLRLHQRVQSYSLLNRFFQKKQFPYIYPVFAFTDDFFDKVHTESYEKTRIKKNEEMRIFPEDFSIAWKSLQEHRLQDFSDHEWEGLQERLIRLYSKAYQTNHPNLTAASNMKATLERMKGQETRLKLKAMVNHLDLEAQEDSLGFSI